MSQILTPPPCITDASQLVYQNGIFAVGQTIQACINNIPDPKLIPVVYNGSYVGESLDLLTRLQVNQIQEIDAISGKVTFDFYLEWRWTDNRMSMPLFWNEVDPIFRFDGIEVSELLRDEKSGFGFWLPNMYFLDELDFKYHGQSIKINVFNTVEWQIHGVATLAESLFDFSHFPYDQQIIVVRYGVFGFNDILINVDVNSFGLTFAENFDGRQNIFFNSEYQFDADEAYGHQYNTTIGIETYTAAVFFLPVTRYAWGILLRIIIPLFIIVELSSATFWIPTPDARVGGVLSLILAVSAVYIIVIGYIPLVGYDTAADTYVLLMMVFLGIMLGFHCVHVSLHSIIYSEEEDLRYMVKYSQPYTYLRDFLRSKLAPDLQPGEKRCVYIKDYLHSKKGGVLKAMKGRGEAREEGQEGEDARVIERARQGTKQGTKQSDSRYHPSVSDRNAPKKTLRELEFMRPRTTLCMYVLQAFGRTVFPSIILQLTAQLMFAPVEDDRAQVVGLAMSLLSLILFAGIGSWESWTTLCKFWELSCAHEMHYEDRETVVHSYVELEGFIAATLENEECSDNFDEDSIGRILDVFEHVVDEHVHLMLTFRKWLRSIARADRLPMPQLQIDTFSKYAQLYQLHDKVRASVFENFEDSLEKYAKKIHDEELRHAFTAAVECQHELLADYPYIQNELREMYCCGKGGVDIASTMSNVGKGADATGDTPRSFSMRSISMTSLGPRGTSRDASPAKALAQTRVMARRLSVRSVKAHKSSVGEDVEEGAEATQKDTSISDAGDDSDVSLCQTSADLGGIDSLYFRESALGLEESTDSHADINQDDKFISN
jgi:hypothetical protein